MRTTITIPEELLKQAQKLTGKTGYSDAIVTSIEAYVALRKRLSLLEDLFEHKAPQTFDRLKKVAPQAGMVLVDTSIWIALYRQQSSVIGQKLWMLAARDEAAVCGQIWVEFLGGFRKAAERSAYQDKLRSFAFLDTTRVAYDLAVELLADHPGLGAGDAIIGATAIASSAALFTIDRDFDVLTKHGLRLFA